METFFSPLVGRGKECIWDRQASCVGSIKYCMRLSTKSLSSEERSALCFCVSVCVCVCAYKFMQAGSLCDALIKSDKPTML